MNAEHVRQAANDNRGDVEDLIVVRTPLLPPKGRWSFYDLLALRQPLDDKGPAGRR